VSQLPEPNYCIDCGREIDASPTRQCSDCRLREQAGDQRFHEWFEEQD